MESVYRYQLTATPEMTDGNRHVNNVVYLKWMQDAAIQHAEKAGCNRIAESMGASWVVRTHRI
jgi:acyl-CoA thioester hydrolase